MSKHPSLLVMPRELDFRIENSPLDVFVQNMKFWNLKLVYEDQDMLSYNDDVYRIRVQAWLDSNSNIRYVDASSAIIKRYTAHDYLSLAAFVKRQKKTYHFRHQYLN